MYDNIGGKIKGLAKVAFIIEVIAAVIIGANFIAIDDDLIGIGLLIMILCSFVGWVSSWLLYGFGELIDQTCAIARNTYGGERKSETQSKIDHERISKINDLLSQGLLTEEEYKQAISKEMNPEEEYKQKFSEEMNPEQALRILKNRLAYDMITEEEYKELTAEIINNL